MAEQSILDALAAANPKVASARPDADSDSRLDALLNRIQELTTEAPTPAPGIRPIAPLTERISAPTRTLPNDHHSEHEGWAPIEPENLAAAGLTDGEVESLILKTLNSRSEATGRNLAEHMQLSFRLVDTLLHSMKHDRLIGHKGSAMANDYVYQLTELGRERAKKFAEHCTYFGSAPVPLHALHRQRQETNARRPASDRRRFAPGV